MGRSGASCGFLLPRSKEAAYFRSLEKTDHGREDMSHYAADLKLFHGCGRSSLEFPIGVCFGRSAVKACDTGMQQMKHKFNLPVDVFKALLRP